VSNKLYYIVSGGFDPLHEGHIALIGAAAKRGDGVILLLNSDGWLTRKKGRYFMNAKTRKAVCESLKGVIDVIEFDDADNTACDGIRLARQKYPDAALVFANGGDRAKENTPEDGACREHNVVMEFGVGGENKTNSSSRILNAWNWAATALSENK
jgi:D-beta-D-heptose 7-phosphate kinase/D-beta-D-heptose 1-phosphate adenosyltransferase